MSASATTRPWRAIAIGVASLLACLLPTARAQAPAAVPATSAADNEAPDPEAPEATKADPSLDKFWESIRLLESKSEAERAAGRQALQEVADLENTHAQLQLGLYLLYGSGGFPRNERKGINLIRLAAERGNAFAQSTLGACYATGQGTRRNDGLAEKWLTAALAPEANFTLLTRPMPKEGDPAQPAESAGVVGDIGNDPVNESKARAHYYLAVVKDRQNRQEEAQRHYVAAATAGVDARSGIYPAAVQAALNYAFGQGVPKDHAKSTEMLELSRKLSARARVRQVHQYVAMKVVDEFATADLEEKAEEAGAGDQMELQARIAQQFADKKSKNYNLAEAAKWYELAAESGQKWALLELALLYAGGQLGPPDPAKAFRYLEKAAGGEKDAFIPAKANLAICYQNGFGTPKDPAKANEIFQRYRNIDIVCHQGAIGKCPTSLVSTAEALKLNETLARSHDPHAQYLLGVRYANGIGVAQSYEEALKWYKRAAAAKHGGALGQLGLICQFNPGWLGIRNWDRAYAQAAAYYRQGAEAGDADATTNYALLFYQGIGVPADPAKAETYFLKALELNPKLYAAHNNLGALYEKKLRALVTTIDHTSINEFRGKMLTHYEAAVKGDFAIAAYNLGLLYDEGVVVAVDKRRSYSYMEQAAAQDLPAAHYVLGVMHERGIGVPVTLTEAAYHYRLAALEGHVDALRKLANFYLTGRGVSSDLERANFWLDQLARRGNAQALTIMIDIQLKNGDYPRAVKTLQAFRNHANAELSGFCYDRLAICYAQGLGVKQNLDRALKYSDIAAQKGNGEALNRLAESEIGAGKIKEGVATLRRAAAGSRDASFSLGKLYYHGQYVDKDEREALRYLRHAADLNHPGAQIFLATLTFNEAPGAPTLEQAIQYAQQAENNGHPQAIKVREKLEQKQLRARPAKEETAGTRSS
ncbi:MAG: sel1 repeat family protein [Opitutaceae bacterium]|nr:sel1 repeat family protein [Opitutaceae bacterium]